MAWGQNSTLTAQSLNIYVGQRFQQLQQILEDLHDLNSGWIAANGSAGVQALPAASGGSQITSGDATTMLSALTDADHLWSIYHGNGSVASNGTVTISNSTGYNFDQFIKQGAGFAPHS